MKKPKEFSDIHSLQRLLLEMAVVAAIYYVAARFGLLLAFQNTNASPVWPPSGIAFAAILLCGHRIWPGILIGAFLANITAFLEHSTANLSILMTASLLVGIGNTLEAVTGFFLVHRFRGFSNFFDQTQDIFKFILAAFLMCLVSAFIGPTSLCLSGIVPWAIYKTVWFTWWLGDVTGVLILTPLLLTFRKQTIVRWEPVRFFEAALLIVSLGIVSYIIFGGKFHLSRAHYALSYLLIPFVVWPALRFGQKWVAATAVAISAVATWGTINGFGPFVVETQNNSLLLLQAFVATVSVMGLVLTAILVERTQAEEALKLAYGDLEHRIEKRTLDLRLTNESLKTEIVERKRIEEKLQIANKTLKEQLEELELLNRIMMDREERIVELKEKLQSLETRSHHPDNSEE